MRRFIGDGTYVQCPGCDSEYADEATEQAAMDGKEVVCRECGVAFTATYDEAKELFKSRPVFDPAKCSCGTATNPPCSYCEGASS